MHVNKKGGCNMTTNALRTMLTIDELAERWRVDRRTIRRMIEDGVISALRVGWQWRIRADEVLRYEASTTEAGK